MNNTIEIPQSIINYAIDKLNDGIGLDQYACDLHHYLFNEDYFIIGYKEAEKWLIENGGIFNIIQEIKEYEQDNFGVVSTDFSSSEKVANMFAYIKGEELLSESEHLSEIWDNILNQEDIDTIIKELKDM